MINSPKTSYVESCLSSGIMSSDQFGLITFSGATLGKGVNRAIATLLAGSLGVGAHHLAVLSGEKVEPFAIGTTVFLIGTYTWMRTSSPEK